MTKADIVREISDKTGVEKSTVSQIVEAFMESVKDANIKGEAVYLRGFGSFILKQRAEKVARNINKNTTITIPAHVIPAVSRLWFSTVVRMVSYIMQQFSSFRTSFSSNLHRSGSVAGS